MKFALQSTVLHLQDQRPAQAAHACLQRREESAKRISEITTSNVETLECMLKTFCISSSPAGSPQPVFKLERYEELVGAE